MVLLFPNPSRVIASFELLVQNAALQVSRTKMVLRRALFFKSLLVVLTLLFPSFLNAAAVSCTIRDSTGAVIPGARIEIRGGDVSRALIATSDGVGHFASADLKPGTYMIRVIAEGFEPLERSIEVGENPVNLDLQMALPVAKQEITVVGKSAKFANTDSVYQNLRKVGLGASFKVDALTVKCDAATFQLNQGTITFLAPVNGVVTGAIFIGSGHFNLKPITGIARAEIKRRLKTDDVEEDFSHIIFGMRERSRVPC